MMDKHRIWPTLITLFIWHSIADNYRLVIYHKAVHVANEMNEKRITVPMGHTI